MSVPMGEYLRRSPMASAIRRAERSGSCVLPTSRAERERYVRAVGYGMLVSPMGSMYARAEYWQDLSVAEQALHCMRTVQRLHPTWVFCGPPAALVYGLEVPERFMWPLRLAKGRGQNTRPSSEFVRVIVEDAHPMVVDQIRVTSFERTVFDCLREMDFADGLALADSALMRSGLSCEELMGRLDVMRNRNHGGLHAMETLRYADPHASGALESRMRARAIELGFIVPMTHVACALPDGRTGDGVIAWERADGARMAIVVDPHLRQDAWAREEVTGSGEMPNVHLARVSIEYLRTLSSFEELLDELGVPRRTGASDRGVEKPFIPTGLTQHGGAG